MRQGTSEMTILETHETPDQDRPVTVLRWAADVAADVTVLDAPPATPTADEWAALPISVLRAHLDPLIVHPGVEDALEALHRADFFVTWLHGIEAMVGMGDGGWRHKDVWKHTKQVVRQSAPRLQVRWAALFHDIGKGRGGDHSLLGAADAVTFCREHGMGEYDTELVKWLVENHLIMSTTAQRKDISDPDVISEFAHRVGSQKRLDHLYLLTVADIRATSDSLWNSWKDALLADLYRATSRALRRGLDNPVAHQDLIRETRAQALGQLTRHGCSAKAVQQFWQGLNADYFLRHSAEEIAWQTRSILDKPEGDDEEIGRAHV